MQNKGFVKLFAIILTLISLFYLSFTFSTRKYYRQAKKYAGGIPSLEIQYLDSLAKEKIWLGYSLEKCRTMELNLGLDLQGGMNIIIEIATSDILKSLSDNNPDPLFNQALSKAIESKNKGQNDFISAFASAYKKLDPNAKLSVLFGTYELREKIRPQNTNEEVITVLRDELKNAYNNSINVIRNRIDKFGVIAPNIQRMDKEGLISIELPGIKEPDRICDLLQGTANLEFWETYLESEIHQTLILANNIIRDSLQFVHYHFKEKTIEDAQDYRKSQIKDSLSKKRRESIVENSSYPLLSLLGLNPIQLNKSCIVASVDKNTRQKINEYLENSKVKNLLNANRLSLKWTVKPHIDRNNIYDLIALKINYIGGKPRPILSGDIIQDANDYFSQNSHCSEVSMIMKSEASKTWERLTKDNIGKSIAIVLDNLVYSYPVVNSEITGGLSQIKGNFTAEQAKDLANVLKSGKMSTRATILQEEIIGPLLGKQAIKQGFISFILALTVLILYLIFIYGWIPGIITSASLILNLLFSLGVMASFHVVLTLSGIAGIILALALAVDANVLIYERIKEEIRNGKFLKKAVEKGYKEAFPTIFDTNLISLITGIILLVFGTGPIQGFAFTLIIGIIISFFTSVFITRASYEFFIAKEKLKNVRFTTKISKNFLVNPTINFLMKKKLLYIILATIIVFCTSIFLFRGLNRGIDYTGGHNYIIKFNQPINTVQAKKLLCPYFKNHTPNVITFGSSNQIRISTNYMIESYNQFKVDSLIQYRLYRGLKTFLPKGTTPNQFRRKYIQSQQKVGPSIANDLKQKTILSIGLSILVIGLYILLRFRDISYSIGSIIALLFDTLFILGTYASLWGFIPFSIEIDQTFIGAILTVIGYSINDKIVIFDRIREYSNLYPQKNKIELFNASINSTLDRTFNTCISTFLVTLIMCLFGGESIRSFSFTMTLGVIISTFSSLFVANPIAYEVQLRKKE